MNPKALIPLVAGLVVAGFAAKLGFDHLKKAKGQPTELVQLWTPVQDIPRGTAVTESHIQSLPYPADIAPPDAIRDPERLIGRVPHTGAPAGVPILESMLLPRGTLPGLHVPDGFRAVGVKIDEASGVDNHLQPGSNVDVIGLFTVRRDNRNETIAKTIIEDVQVAAVGQRLAPSVPKPGESTSQSGRPAKPARAVTLLVKPDQVPLLHLAEQRGKIKLSMRSAGGIGVTNGAAFTENELLDPESEPVEQQHTFADQIAALFEGFGQQTQTVKPEPKPEPEPEPAQVEKQEPVLAWRMVIHNGSDTLVYGWEKERLYQPILLDSSEGPNIFENDGWDEKHRKQKRTKKIEKGKKAGTDSDPNEAESESEPEELFE